MQKKKPKAKTAKAAPVEAFKPKHEKRKALGRPAKVLLAAMPALPSQGKKLTVADLPAIIELFQSMKISRLIGENFDFKLTLATENRGRGETNEKPTRQGAAVDPGSPARVALDPEAERDIELAQKLIDDPLGYEQAQIDAHLGRDNGGIRDEQDESSDG